MTKTYNIDIHCALCASKVEDVLNKLDIINSCSINFITQKMIIDFNTSEEDMLQIIHKKIRKVAPDFVIKKK